MLRSRSASADTPRLNLRLSASICPTSGPVLCGRRESGRAPILTFLVVGGMLINPANWTPFAPSGFAGIVTGGAIVFFTYIGFDSVSTAAEECKTPQRDLPFGIIM